MNMKQHKQSICIVMVLILEQVIQLDWDIKDKLMSLNTLPGTELSAFDNGNSSGLRDALPGTK